MEAILDSLHPKEKEEILKLSEEYGSVSEIVLSRESGIGLSVSVRFDTTDQEFDVTYYSSW